MDQNLLPKYCDFYKFFLVEEIALEQDYRQLHYGKCSLLGKLRENPSGDFELENIKLPNLENKYSLPEGTLSIRLLRFNYFGTGLKACRYSEVCGEVVLLDVHNPQSNRLPLTARGVLEQLHRVREEKERDELLANLLKTHKPAIRLNHINEIDRAGELAERNLEIRMLMDR